MTIAAFTKAYRTELKLCLSGEEQVLVSTGKAVPNDFYDANMSMLSAWEEAFGVDPFEGDGHMWQDTLDIMNKVMDEVHPTL